VASGDGHLSGGQAAARETAAGEGAGAVAAILAPETAARMAAAALALIGAVTREQQVVLNPGFDDFDPESPRRHWTYLPELERPGLPLRALSDAQRKLAHELITASVSMEGYAKVVSIMAMEHVRRALMLVSAPSAAHLFDQERYGLRIIGAPGGPGVRQPAPWGWQFAGHHVVLNFTVAGDYVSGTPCMLGSVPASYGALSPLEHEEADGFAFVNALSAEQRARAVIWHRPPPDFATRIVPRIGEVELPDHVFPPEPDYRISDEERAALAYVRSGPRGIKASDSTLDAMSSTANIYPRLGMVLMMFRSLLRAFRSADTWTCRLLSSTTVSGHTRARISLLVTSLPGVLINTIRRSNARLPRSAGSPSTKNWRERGSSRNRRNRMAVSPPPSAPSLALMLGGSE